MPQPPNILFIISDQHRWDAAGCYGHEHVQTPSLDRLAAEGVRFTQAYCNSPLCVTSRSSVMTGLYPHTNGALVNNAPPLPDHPTLGSVFRAAGYRTGAIGKVHIKGETRERDLGFDDRAMRLYTHWFEDYIEATSKEVADTYALYRNPLERYQVVYNPENRGIALEEGEMYDALVVARSIEFMEANQKRPWFLWAGLEKPHPDWYAPEEYHRLYDPAEMVVPETAFEERRDMPEAWYVSTRQSWAFAPEELPRCIAAYYANVTYLDAKVGELLAALDRLELAENTIVVYSTDHGEMLFDHGMVQKQNFFEGSAHIPLIVRHPQTVPAGETRTGLVSLLDLFPTWCEQTGVEAPHGLEGESLVSDLAGETSAPERAVLSEYYDWGFAERMIRQGPWKYIYSDGQPGQLYNLETDPLEQDNRCGTADCASVQAQLHDRLMADWEIPDLSREKPGGYWNDPAEWYAGEAEARARRAGTETAGQNS